MFQHRTAVRLMAGLLTTGIVVIGGLAPAMASGGSHNGVSHAGHRLLQVNDTGWNGTKGF